MLVRRGDLAVIATVAGGRGNRNDPVHYRGTIIERIAKAHGRVLADGGYRGFPSYEHRGFAAGASYETEPGDSIAANELAPSMQLLASRTGACSETTVDAAGISTTPCPPLLCFIIY